MELHGHRILSATDLTTDHTDGTDRKIDSSSSVSSVKSVVQIPDYQRVPSIKLPLIAKTSESGKTGGY